MPGAEVGEITVDHLGRVGEFGFAHGGVGEAFDVFDYDSAVIPAVEVATVER